MAKIWALGCGHPWLTNALAEQIVRRDVKDRSIEIDVLDDDFGYVVGLGLVRLERGHWVIANPIHREVIPRALTFVRQGQLFLEPAVFVRPDGSLDLPRLMAEWQLFWREDGHLAAEGFRYREAGPHLMLMAFLQRVANGGGKIQRDGELGRAADAVGGGAPRQAGARGGC